MTAPAPAWRRWLLLATLFAIGLLWVCAFALFRTRSVDFLADRFAAAARDRARIPAPELPVVLDFRRGGTGTQLLGSGWWAPDEDATWSWSPRVSVFVRRPRADGELWLTFTGDAYVPRNRGRFVRLYVDGVRMGEWRALRDRPRVHASVRLAAPPPDGVMEIEFEVDGVAAPFRTHKLRDDPRTLGFGLQRIELTDAPSGPPAAP